MASYKDVLPGKYRGKVVDWGFSLTQAGLPQVMVLFRLEGIKTLAGATETADMIWYGSFKTEKSQEISLRTLIRLGLRTNNPADMVDADGGPLAGALDTAKEFELDVQSKTDLQGKSKIGIQWVNEIGGGLNSAEKLGQSDLRSKLNALNLDGVAMSLRQEMNRPVQHGAAASRPATAQPPAAIQPSFGEDDIPF